MKNLNTKMKVQERKIILFIDNFSAHNLAVDSVDLTNIRVEFLPPNCTSLVQPVDQGIGNTLKFRFRKFLNEHITNSVFLDREPEINLLRVVTWLGKAWNSLNGKMTVSK